MNKESINFGLNECGIDFFGNGKSSIFNEEKDFKKSIDEIITPVDNFISQNIQEHLEKNNYFQDFLDIVENLKENGEDIGKNYHAIVGIGEMQDYFRNIDLQDKVILILKMVEENLEKIFANNIKITEEEEKQLNHIKRYINKRGLKKGEYSNFIKEKLQLIQGLSTKIVNNTKLIENKEGYEKKIEFKNLFVGIKKDDIAKILLNIKDIQLTKGCSGNCRGCSFDALNRKKLRTNISWSAIKKIIDGLGEKKLHTFYFASDPLDWQDEEAGKKYSDIAKYYFDKFETYPEIATKLPNNDYSIKALEELWYTQIGGPIRISVTKKNYQRVFNFISEVKKNKPNDFSKLTKDEYKKQKYLIGYNSVKKDRVLALNTNKGIMSISIQEFLERDNSDITDELYYPLGKNYDYSDNVKMNNFNSSDFAYKIIPDGVLLNTKVCITSFYPNGYSIEKIDHYKSLEEKKIDYRSNEEIYEILNELAFSFLNNNYFNYLEKGHSIANTGNSYNNKYSFISGLIKDYRKRFELYLQNNPSHKLYFKKKFEKLINTEFYDNVLELFEILGLKK